MTKIEKVSWREMERDRGKESERREERSGKRMKRFLWAEKWGQAMGQLFLHVEPSSSPMPPGCSSRSLAPWQCPLSQASQHPLFLGISLENNKVARLCMRFLVRGHFLHTGLHTEDHPSEANS